MFNGTSIYGCQLSLKTNKTKQNKNNQKAKTTTKTKSCLLAIEMQFSSSECDNIYSAFNKCKHFADSNLEMYRPSCS